MSRSEQSTNNIVDMHYHTNSDYHPTDNKNNDKSFPIE